MTRISDDDIAAELGRLRALARRLARDPELADEAVQETALIALRQRPGTVRSVRSWLSAVLQSRVRRLASRERRRTAVESRAPTPSEHAPSAADAAATAELHRRIAGALVELPEPYRTAVPLRLLRDLPLAAVAAETGTSVEAARTRVRRGLDLLRRRLDDGYGGRSGWIALLGVPCDEVPVTPPLPVVATGVLTMKTKQAAVACTVAAIAVVGLLAWRAFDGSAPPPEVVPSVDRATAAVLADDATSDPERRAVATGAASPTIAPPLRGPSVLWGRVVRTASEAPVANAHVALLYRPADEFASVLDRELAACVEEVGTAVTDGNGGFAFDVERGHPYRVRVTAPGAAVIEREGLTGGAEVLLRVAAPARVGGRVVDAGGAPVPDANVTAWSKLAPERMTRTDGAGTFLLDGLHPSRVRLIARDHGGMEGSTWVELEPGGFAEVVLQIEAGQVLCGTVIEAMSGRAVAGAVVSDSWTFGRTAATDGEGGFVLRVDEHAHHIHARADGYAHALRGIPADAKGALRVEMHRSGTIRGRVLSQDGEPLGVPYVAAAVTRPMVPMDHTDWINGRVGPDGRFMIPDIDPSTTYQLLVTARGKGRRLLDLPRRVVSGEVFDVGEVVLCAEGRLEGRVVDDHGAPIAGVSVSLRGPAAVAVGDAQAPAKPLEIYYFASRSLLSAADGSFRFAGLGSGEYSLYANRPEASIAAAARRTATVQDGRTTEGVELVLSGGGVITGRVVAPRGWGKDEFVRLELMAYGADREATTHVRVGADGRFAFEHLRDGVYTVAALRGVEGWHVVPVTGVRDGDAELSLEVVPAGKIAGRVVGPDGKPRRAKVFARAKETDAPNFIIHDTDDDGRFSLSVAPDFHGSVTAQPPGIPFGDRRDHVVAGTTDLVLKLGQ